MADVRPVKLVIFDLDGTILDSETAVLEVAKEILERHGAQLTQQVRQVASGRRPLEAWQATIDVLGLQNVSAQQLFDESELLLKERVGVKDRWEHARLMPGAGRLLWHLHHQGVPMALATSTPRATFERKMSGHLIQTFGAMFQAVHTGDDVQFGKPAPDCFRQTASSLGVDPADCLVIEDAPSGVEAATAAGMRVVTVPSLRVPSAYPEASPHAQSGCVEVLPSLFDFRPERYGLQPFQDLVEGLVPVDPPWCIKGEVVKGFGRGSRQLGIPTANLSSESLQGTLAEAVTGIYCGWCSLGSSPEVYPMCMSIGWNPFYNNEQKTAEPWILHSFDRDFYGEELRLLICGYIRPEANFTSLEALIERIQEDRRVTEAALSSPLLSSFKADPFLKPGPNQGGSSKD